MIRSNIVVIQSNVHLYANCYACNWEWKSLNERQFREYYLLAAVQLPCTEFKDTPAALIAVLIIDCWQNCCASRHIKVSLWYYQVPTNQKLFGISRKSSPCQKWWRAKIERTNNLIKNKPHRCALLHIIRWIKSIMLEAF